MNSVKTLKKDLEQVKFKKHKIPKEFVGQVYQIEQLCGLLLSQHEICTNINYLNNIIATSLILEQYLAAKKYKLYNDRLWVRATKFFSPEGNSDGDTDKMVEYMRSLVIAPEFVLTKDGYLFSLPEPLKFGYELPQSASLRMGFPVLGSIQRRSYSSSEFPTSQALASHEQACVWSYSASIGSNGNSVR